MTWYAGLRDHQGNQGWCELWSADDLIRDLGPDIQTWTPQQIAALRDYFVVPVSDDHEIISVEQHDGDPKLGSDIT